MINLGGWAPYINLDEMLGWYSLPPTLARDLRGFVPNGGGLQPISKANYEFDISEVLRAASGLITPEPAHHNADHFNLVHDCGLQLFDVFSVFNTVPTVVGQALGVALLLHDIGHAGYTFRADTPLDKLVRPDLGINTSVEWVSSLIADEILLCLKWSPLARLFVTYVIWSSTYGGHTLRGQQLGIPLVEPSTFWGCLMRAADICPRAAGDHQGVFSAFARQSVIIHYLETMATAPPANWDEFIDSMLNFTGYVAHCFSRVNVTSGIVNLADMVGWRERLETIIHNLKQVRVDPNGDGALIVREALAEFGVLL